MSQMPLKWNRCQGDAWCQFRKVDLNHSHFTNMNGVYIIWHGGTAPATVYVGKGRIAQRIGEHRNDNRFSAFDSLGLFVTWAQVPAGNQDGVERYLHSVLNPRLSSVNTSAYPIQVNLPW